MQADDAVQAINEKLDKSGRRLEGFSVAARIASAASEVAGGIKKNLDADAAADKILAVENEIAERATKMTALPADKQIGALMEMEMFVKSKLGDFEGMHPEIKQKAINSLGRTSDKLVQQVLVAETKKTIKKREDRLKASTDLAAHLARPTNCLLYTSDAADE